MSKIGSAEMLDFNFNFYTTKKVALQRNDQQFITPMWS